MDDFCESLITDVASMKIHTPIYLPHVVIESNILTRLPVKSLLRFQAVCKNWLATISDPIFVHAHLQESKNSMMRSFFAPNDWELRRITVENDQLRELSPLVSSYNKWRMWCYSDGVFLISCPPNLADYVVWNPSRRAHKELRYPYPVDNSCRSPPMIGIYYHSVDKDYKVVVVGGEHYAVFSCKNNSWGEMRTNAISSNIVFGSDILNQWDGVAYKESIYWFRYLSDVNDDDERRRRRRRGIYQIVCFDGKDEKLSIFCNLDPFGPLKRLFTSQDGLYLSSHTSAMGTLMITKILPVWMEYEVQLPFPYMTPLGFTPQNNKLIFVCRYDGNTYVLYDLSGTETTTLQSSFDLRRVDCYRLFPCIETLFLV